MKVRIALALLAAALSQPAAAQLTRTGLQEWHGDSPGLSTAAEAGAWLGHAAAAGDFDGDGFDDLALGAPRRTVGNQALAGEVLVLYGAPGGLAAAGHQVWNQNTAGIADTAEANDSFGRSLAVGDFDGDGFDDLVIGVPFEGIFGLELAGALHVLRGSPAGLTAAGSLFLHQSSAGVADAAEAGDQFAAALAVGDFDQDGFDDLAVGVPGEGDEGGPTYAALGALHVFFGSSAGLTTAGSRFYRPGDGVVTAPSPADAIAFGAALAAGPLLLNGQDQIVIGVPRLEVAQATGAGGIVILANPAAGGSIIGIVTQASPDIPSEPETGESFGATLAVGRFDGGARASVAVGAPGEWVDGTPAAGAVFVLAGLSTPQFSATVWAQEDLPPLASEAGDRFGAALAVGDFDADGHADLAIGAPNETVDGVANIGGGAVVYGTPGGLTAAGAQILPLGEIAIVGDLQLGHAFAAGRFSGHSGDDLAMTLPRADIGTEADAGAARIFPSAMLFRDGFESGDTSRWSEAAG